MVMARTGDCRGAVVELYEDRRSGWRVLVSRGGTIAYRFIIVDRAGRSTFAADAMELAGGRVPAGLEQVDLDVDSAHGMVLIEPCALWSRGRVRRTATKPGVLTGAYIAGEMSPGASAGNSEQPAVEQPAVVLRVQSSDGGRGGELQLVAPQDRATSQPAGEGRPHRVRVDGDRAQPHLVVLGRGKPMPRTSANGSITRGRSNSAASPDARVVVSRITELVAANEQLERANGALTEENQRLRGELTAIRSALGSPTGGRGRRRRGGALMVPEARTRQKRRPITDPDVLARRSAALAKARAARAEKLALAKAGAAGV